MAGGRGRGSHVVGPHSIKVIIIDDCQLELVLYAKLGVTQVQAKVEMYRFKRVGLQFPGEINVYSKFMVFHFQI